MSPFCTLLLTIDFVVAAVCLKLSLESRAVLNFGRHVASDKCR